MKKNITESIKRDGQLDSEWVELILEALETGISMEEIKDFLTKKDSPVIS